MRRVPAAIVALLLAAGLALAPLAAAAVPAGGATADLGGGDSTDSVESNASTGSNISTGSSASSGSNAASVQEDAPPDPDSDRIGWEAGYWHNETIQFDQTDGVSDDELEAIVARTMARVEEVRRLEFEETVDVEIVSREEFRNQGANRSVNESLRTFDNAKFEAMFLVGEEEDSIEVQNAGRGSSVLGYYSPSQDAIVLVANNESAMKIDEYTLAHELVHALQDQQFDLASYTSETRDGANANNGIIEGDANYVQHRYERRCNDPEHSWNDTCVTPPDGEAGGGGAPPNMGVYFLQFQPYSDGPKFVSSVYADGGWEAVNAVYDDPPASAEQVIHPEKYGSDQPTNVSLEDRHEDGWERVRPPNRADHAEVGQSGVASMLVYPLYAGGQGGRIVDPNTWLNYTSGNQVSRFDPLNYGFDYAEGWDGDRMHVYRNDDGETAYVWRIAWDDADEAAEFRDGYEQLLGYWGAEQVGPNTYRAPEDAQGGFADAFHVVVEGDTVTVVNAPTVEQLSEVRSSVEVQTTTETPSDDEPAVTDGSATTDERDEVDTRSPTDATTPGFAVVTAVVALLLAALVAARRDL